MASTRGAARDLAGRLARARLVAEPQRPWDEWRGEDPVAALLRVTGPDRRALREALGLVLSDYLRGREPAKGLAGVYLFKAVLAVEQAEHGEQTVRLPHARDTASTP